MLGHKARVHEEPENEVCNICQMTFATSDQLKKHDNVHMPKYFSCHDCVKIFETKSGLMDHVRKKHGNIPHLKI